MHFSLVTAAGRRLKGPLTGRRGGMIACWSADISPVITELISQFTDTRRRRAGARVQCPAVAAA